ncbi:MAG TPA: hypothetical protein VLS90_12090 [Thermodesulfobacteriota bacterium]|nr:hypothetical protein [Thermodesulfobacteriota bacterium]
MNIRNCFEIATSFAFFIMGLVILCRSIVETGLILGVVVGSAFLGYGIFRLRYVWIFFFSKGGKA